MKSSFFSEKLCPTSSQHSFLSLLLKTHYRYVFPSNLTRLRVRRTWHVRKRSRLFPCILLFCTAVKHSWVQLDRLMNQLTDLEKSR
jgi:hypothetical protein